jgi:hypothetical protein
VWYELWGGAEEESWLPKLEEWEEAASLFLFNRGGSSGYESPEPEPESLEGRVMWPDDLSWLVVEPGRVSSEGRLVMSVCSSGGCSGAKAL